MGTFKLSEWEYQDVISDYKAGVKVDDIAFRFGVSDRVIYRIIASSKLDPSFRRCVPKKIPQHIKDEIIRLYQIGLGSKPLSLKFKVSISSVLRILNNAGVKVRYQNTETGCSVSGCDDKHYSSLLCRYHFIECKSLRLTNEE